jgi:aspartyl aminopeptidase
MRQEIDIEEYIPFAEKACDFLSNSPDPYHCVQNNVNKLRANGYVALSKKKPFAGVLEPGGKYFYTVNKTTLVAFAVGHNYKAGNGFKIIGGECSTRFIGKCISSYISFVLQNGFIRFLI